MLDTLTKRRIDTARDILVGKLPDPKSQVEQITIALIYKFMDDMDKQSEELGGKTKFFTGEYEKYSWSKIFDPRVSGYELVGLYGEAIQKMNHNPNIPQLFRNIFKNAYLPYRDPETLKMFLKVIGEFGYDYSEKLGDAFEYLLSIMGSQGDAGQFRTPRHIIDFMVKVVDPSKNETILDPACGTAGFLISSFNHIQNKNKKDGRIDLTPDERTRLINNFSGYDISPDMVRLSLVNMYLHKFPAPKIYEYDTLTSEEKWNEFYDIILANPPFMSPRGGIKPHKRFSVQAKRSEVLFVDYIAEHLNPNGRGGVIVPEGIIFQSGIAYKKLRKMLVENSLYAVVSLPAGVFNPYAGVKTSILFLNKNLAKKTDKILFVKVNNDGFGLGAQRREIKENDLPLALEIIKKYKQSVIEGKELEFNLNETKLANIVKKEKIAESGDYNLSGDRYKEAVVYSGKWDFVELGELCKDRGEYGSGAKKIIYDGNVRYMRITDIDNEGNLKATDIVSPSIIEEKYFLQKGDLLFARSGSVGRCYLHKLETGKYQFAGYLIRFKTDRNKILPDFIFYLTKSEHYWNWIKNQSKTGTLTNINAKQFSSFKIPLPPLEIQEQIVAELDSYQKIIDGARQVVENYKPTFKIDPEWEIKKLEELCNLVRGSSPRPKGDKRYYGGKIPRLMISDITRDGMYTSPKKDTLTEIGTRLSRPMKKGNVIMAVSGNPGLPTILAIDACIHDGFVGFKDLSSSILPEFLYLLLLYYKDTNNMQSIGAVFKNLNTNQIKHFNIPVPSIQVQKQIITKIENEQKIINANKELITIFENKIKDKIAEVWGE
jgi:type I restriction enzyme M protein